MEYIIGEDEKGKFVKFEINGARATIRFDATNAMEAVASTKRILGNVFERIEKEKLQNGVERYNETSILSVSGVNERSSGS